MIVVVEHLPLVVWVMSNVSLMIRKASIVVVSTIQQCGINIGIDVIIIRCEFIRHILDSKRIIQAFDGSSKVFLYLFSQEKVHYLFKHEDER